MVESVVMAGYSLLLVLALVLGSPWWVARMFFSAGSGRRYRAGLGQRLGRVPAGLREAVRGRRVVWVHAVSVGEVLAATRLVEELGAELGAGWRIVVSTTTATGQALARERFAAGVGDAASGDVGAGRVFYYPLDFAWAVRAYLRVLQAGAGGADGERDMAADAGGVWAAWGSGGGGECAGFGSEFRAGREDEGGLGEGAAAGFIIFGAE